MYGEELAKQTGQADRIAELEEEKIAISKIRDKKTSEDRQRITELEAEVKQAEICTKELQSDCIHYSGKCDKLEAQLKAVQEYLDRWINGEMTSLDTVNLIDDSLAAIRGQDDG